MSAKNRNPYPAIIAGLSLLLAAACFFYYFFSGVPEFPMRCVFLCMILLICFVPKKENAAWEKVLSLILMALSIAACVYLILFNEAIKVKFQGLDIPDLVMGIILVLLILEATRRKVGWAMPVIAVCFILYGLCGYLIPGRYSASHFSISRIISFLYTGTEGIFGSALAIMLSTIYLFIIFGGLLETTGGGPFIAELSKSICSKSIGGSAKVAAFSGMLFGSISGSAVAITAATGSFSIPMMKQSGYSDRFSGAVCAVASTGGQMMPPVMGAGAFLIAEMVGISYRKIVLVSILPALMFYLALFWIVHYEAKKKGMTDQPSDQTPNVRSVLKKDGVTVLPLLILLVLVIFSGLSVAYSALLSLLAMVVVGLIRNKGNAKFILDGIISTTSSIASTAICCACAGIVIGMISLTGLGYSFSNTLMSLSGGNLLLGLLLVLLLSIVLGMGLPTTPAFILAASVAGTGLIGMGLPPVVAYLVIFWFAQTSNITPPVCMASYAAAAISGASPMKVGLTSLKLGLPIIIIPFLMAYRGLLLTGSVLEFLVTAVTGIIGLYCFAVLVVGYMKRPFRRLEYLLAFIGAIGALYPSIFCNLIGVVVLLALCLSQHKSDGVAPKGEGAQ